MVRFGCQTYSWQMSLEKYRGRIDHISSVVAEAGFLGLEAEVVMLGDFATAERLATVLQRTGLELAALTLVEDWTEEHESAAERSSADAAIALTSGFEGALLVLCQMPGRERRDLRQRQENLFRCVQAISERASDAGVKTTFHPNSPEGSLFRTSDDYEVLLNGLPAAVGFAPDLGHIAKGGMDPLSVVKLYRERVNHVHAKDMGADGQWALIGSGVVPVAEVAQMLARTGYEGWLVLEDESEAAERDPDSVAAQLGRYVAEVLEPAQEAAGGEGDGTQDAMAPGAHHDLWAGR